PPIEKLSLAESFFIGYRDSKPQHESGGGRRNKNNLKMLFLDDGRRLLLSKGSASNRGEKHATE
ncbi:MAG: hypothetical protein IKR92_02995, partial [Alphaproteobacteria bacterium]|nr:hypothetical protein [Alphaproteobacteria bacterium]